MRKMIYSAYDLGHKRKSILGIEHIPLWDVVSGFGMEQGEHPIIRDLIDRYGQDIAIGPLVGRDKERYRVNGEHVVAIYSLL